MSIKSTRTITREQALQTLAEEIEHLSNDMLAVLLHDLAKSKESRVMSSEDELVVSNFMPPDSDSKPRVAPRRSKSSPPKSSTSATTLLAPCWTPSPIRI